MNCVWKNREEFHEFLMKIEQRIERDEEIPEERRTIIEAIKSKKYDFIRCNFPNGDMVGHTGSLDSTIIGVEAVD